MDTKVQARINECNDLIKFIGMEQDDKLVKMYKEQLRNVVSKLWDDHSNYMGNHAGKKERHIIWTTLNNGLHTLQRT